MPADLLGSFRLMKRLVDEHVPDAGELDYTVMAEALNFSGATADEVREIMPLLTGIHGKFYEMTEVPGQSGTYQDVSIDYETLIGALRDGGYDGYINSEYEGQRFFQDRGIEDLADEVEQVRRHQEMLRRLIGA